jgi:hypothetical protein
MKSVFAQFIERLWEKADQRKQHLLARRKAAMRVDPIV